MSAQDARLEALIRPRSVAIVGASADASRTAGKPALYLRKHGYAGTTYLVNPRYASIDGTPCFPSVADLPAAPDVGLVMLGPDAAELAVRQLAERGARAAIVLAGGYAETDALGSRRQIDLLAAAGAMRLLGPNTIGVINVADAIALSASLALDVSPLTGGSVSVVSQSGGMLGALLSRGEAAGLGFSKLVATGNEADVDVCDVVDYLLDDPTTTVIALYLESVRRPARFREVAASAARLGKPLVVLKVGRSEAGAQSATSHTGALAGVDRLYAALFAQTGALRVNALNDLIDASAALVAGKRLHGSRIGILTSTGGAASLVADACGVQGFSAPPPDRATATRLGALLTGAGTDGTRNPIDLTLANLRSETYRDAIAALMDSDTYDSVVVVVGSSGLGQPQLAAAPVLEAASKSEKPLLVFVSPHALNIVSYLNGHGVPAFATPEGCAAGLAALRHRELVAPPVSPPSGSRTAPAPILGSGPLNEAESLAAFATYGIRCVEHQVATTPDAAVDFARRVGSPIVIKILSRDVSHKSEIGGVRVNVPPADVAAVCEELRVTFAEKCPEALFEGWLVQEQIAGGVEVLLGAINDSQLGPALMLGAGGIATEVFDDSAVRLLPLGRNDPTGMLEALKSRVLLQGFRGRPGGDVEALFTAMRAFADLVQDLGERLVEAEINPLFVLPTGQGVRAADGVIVLG